MAESIFLERDASAEQIRHTARTGNPDSRLRAATHRNCPPDVRRTIASDDVSWVASGLAKHLRRDPWAADAATLATLTAREDNTWTSIAVREIAADRAAANELRQAWHAAASDPQQRRALLVGTRRQQETYEGDGADNRAANPYLRNLALEDPDPRVRAVACRSFWLTDQQRDKLRGDPDPQVRVAAFETFPARDLTEDVIKDGAEDPDPQVRLYWAGRAHMDAAEPRPDQPPAVRDGASVVPLHLREQLAADPDPRVVAEIAKTELSPQTEIRLATSPDPNIRKGRASTRVEPRPEVLAIMAVDANPRIRSAVPRWPSTPQQTIDQLATDPAPQVRRTVALTAHQISADAQLHLANDPEENVREALTHNTRIDFALKATAQLATDASFVVRRYAAKLPQSRAAAKHLALDTDISVRENTRETHAELLSPRTTKKSGQIDELQRRMWAQHADDDQIEQQVAALRDTTNEDQPYNAAAMLGRHIEQDTTSAVAALAATAIDQPRSTRECGSTETHNKQPCRNLASSCPIESHKHSR